MKYEEMKKTLLALNNPADKLEAVIDFGKNLQDAPADAVCTDIRGCASRVEICKVGDKLFARADAIIVRGIVAILLAMVEGKTSDEIKNMNMVEEFRSLDLQLGVGRVGGVHSMISFLQNL